VNKFVLYLVLGIAAAGSQTSTQPPQPQAPQQSARPKLSASEVSKLRASAEGGDASAQLALGKAYEGGNGVPKNDESAVKWYRKAAEQGNAEAENRLGVMYRIGQGVSRDKEEAVRWYHKAARQGNPQALFNLGVSYYNGDGVPSDQTLAYAWFLLAQAAGNPAADDAVKRSTEEGGRLGTPEALQQVAAIYEKGDDLPQSYSEAAKWYGKAAELSPIAGVHLAEMFINATGVPHDYAQAMTLCQNAAKQHYAPGRYCAGFLYQHGLGTPANPKEAVKLYEMASREGQPQAMMALAEMNWKGEGVGVNRADAYYYFFMAHRKGAPDAKARAKVLWKEMTKDDIKSLEKKLRAHYDPQTVFAEMQDESTPDAAKGESRP
jgi:TPR repeat protein